MFTGLVAAMGRIAACDRLDGAIRLSIEGGALARQTAVGDSVAVDGCCLTVVAREGERMVFEAIPETLRRTTLGERSPGDRVNLELPVRPVDRLGGHFVQGHVDAVTELLDRSRMGDDVLLTFALPPVLAGFIVEKGSVALDGVSMTLAGVDSDRFSVAVIPHTLAVTTLGLCEPGSRVNVEGDILAKYVASLVAGR